MAEGSPQPVPTPSESLHTPEHCEQQPNGKPIIDNAEWRHTMTSTQPTPTNRIPIREEVLGKPSRKIRVISIGAGFSGLTLANKIQRTFKLDDIIDHVLYEKNPEIGGTWYENRYPGVACDVPAHSYTLLDLPNPEWNNFYATGGEILEYLKRIARDHNLYRDVRLNSTVTSAIWDNEKGQWAVQIRQDGRTIDDWCDVLINGSGFLNNWKWPDIPGLSDFQGLMCHSADWRDEYDLSGLKVAVIGNGSSGLQIVPEIQKVAAHVTNFARSKTWITAQFAENLSKEPGKNPAYTDEEKENFRNDLGLLNAHRRAIAHAFNHFYEALIEGSDSNNKATDEARSLMLKLLNGDKKLADKIIPDWSLGCRRLTPGTGYLGAISQSNADLVTEPIETITQTGIKTVDGTEREYDAIVCATGFDVSFIPRWKQLGLDGRSLAEEWADDATSYFSLAVSGQPNYFIFNGPAGPVGHGSLSGATDWSANYIIKWLIKIASEDIKSFDVKQDVQNDWNVWGDELLKRTVWAGGCRSWYKNGRVDGRITALYPGSIMHYKEMIQHIRGEDFNITYRSKNRWNFLGNGFTQREADGGDLGYYIE
ncbi:hypothetical protein AJ79_07134 [Helicocarpus griseus UAMH5409]|uniref:FAD/NAD(P)-binding domain-containing protein n=1 Tax=Helicocarpus griseus UAMH5409 TaxID=1447875 RepID=A0A2B7X6C3_9EURO|nr:hypothetical protein AJ79_07134 [Helicocarpus griseus UAMH5409]